MEEKVSWLVGTVHKVLYTLPSPEITNPICPLLVPLVLHPSEMAFFEIYFHCHINPLDCCCHEGAGADGCDGCLNWKGMDWERMKSDAEEKRCRMKSVK